MLEVLASPPSDATPPGDARWHTLLDELIAGGCSEDEFVSRVCEERDASPDAAWSAVAILDQRFRRGQVSPDIYRSIGAKISQRELRKDGDGTTVSQRTHRWRRMLAQQPPSTLTTPQPHLSAGAALREEVPVPRVIVPGRVLRDRYVLEARLGIGGMGTVYKALDRYREEFREDVRHVAIKILHETTVDEDMGRLRREFFCAQGLSHPHIIKVYEIDRDADVAFFTMELLEGSLLDALIGEARPGAVPRSVAWVVIRDAASALAYAHSRQVVHGDLKPQNIMITEKGEVRVLDFGASSDPSRLVGIGDAAAGEASELTPAYACIEILEGQAPAPADDLYALACVSYELLTGRHPFEGHTAIEARDLNLAPLRPQDLSERQWVTLKVGLAHTRSDRCMSVSDWVAEMMSEPAGARAVPASSIPSDAFVSRAEEALEPDVSAVTEVAQPLDPALTAPLPAESPAAVTSPVPLTMGSPAMLESPARVFEYPDSLFVLPPPGSSRSSRMPNSTLLVALLVCATVWAAVSRPWTGARLASDQVPSRIQVVTQIDPMVAAVEPDPPESLVLPPGLSAAIPERDTRPLQAQSGSSPPRLRFSAESYRVRAGQGFAELHVVRPGVSEGDAGFVWWTEGGSALAGLDYVAQNPALQQLAGSRRRATLFVKVPAGVDRATRKTFFVAMTDPHGRSISGVLRAMVTIPAQTRPRQLLSSATR